MARIPIAEIPNAPDLSKLTLTSENVPRPNLSGIADTLLTPTLNLNAFSGEAQGLQAMGQGLQNLGENTSKAVAQAAPEVAQVLAH